MGETPQQIAAAARADGQIAYQRCGACGSAVVYLRVLCPVCGSTDLTIHRSAGRGVVYSTTTLRGRDGARDISLIDLEEGVRVMGTVTGVAPEDVRIGAAVQGGLDPEGGDEPRVVFTLADG
ncbi:MAG: OB-fold domain-containing protein [Solirubrobacteraceae bacterium]|nr:OB-fold domain-containing protein [Solirubrobacteraceae bacterium]